MKMLTTLALAGLLAPLAIGQDIPWTLEGRVKKAEDRLDRIEWRLDQLDRAAKGKTPEAKAQPRSRRVEVNGLWYDQYEDGRMVACEECNRGKVAVWARTVATPNDFARPVWGVPAQSPFMGPYNTGTTTVLTSYPMAVNAPGFSSTYQVQGLYGAPTNTRARFAGGPGTISRFFRGGCSTGGCP
jgi:hypothetical protein